MINKEQKKNFSDVEYRFSFALTINDVESKSEDIIICKRDFNIYNLVSIDTSLPIVFPYNHMSIINIIFYNIIKIRFIN